MFQSTTFQVTSKRNSETSRTFDIGMYLVVRVVQPYSWPVSSKSNAFPTICAIQCDPCQLKLKGVHINAQTLTDSLCVIYIQTCVTILTWHDMWQASYKMTWLSHCTSDLKGDYRWSVNTLIAVWNHLRFGDLWKQSMLCHPWTMECVQRPYSTRSSLPFPQRNSLLVSQSQESCHTRPIHIRIKMWKVSSEGMTSV